MQLKSLFGGRGCRLLKTALLPQLQCGVNMCAPRVERFDFGTKPSSVRDKNNHKNNKVLARHGARRERTYFEKSGWLPEKKGLQAYVNKIVRKVRLKRKLLKEEGAEYEYCEPIQELENLIATDSTVNHLVTKMLSENQTLMVSPDVSPEQAPGMGIETLDDLLGSLDLVLQGPPEFSSDTELVGVPIAAIFTGVDATLSGQALFILPQWNLQLTNILSYWNTYLNNEDGDSNSGFMVDGEGWLSPEATQNWTPEIYVKDSETLPYYKTWNSFFTRDFADKENNRPIGGEKDNNSIVTAPQDGAFYCIDTDILDSDAFWFKDMPYSLNDIFGYGASDEQRAIFDEYKLVERFENGHIFQCFLGPYNFHRWWSPVSGKILFDPQVVPGFYYSKNKIPDIAGSTTDSVRYLLHCNARGIVVIDTGDDDIGYVCCVPIGMCEVSTVRVNDWLQKDKAILKGNEIGTFEFGGSTFAIIFEDLTKYKKAIKWQTDRPIDIDGEMTTEFPVNQEVETPSVSGTGNILCGMQIATITPYEK